ncbi:MAG TPA: hypothetical protein VMJ10_24530 [Kofleriaceae bacterium]|nr:hypothetical protein [Kofleriaceae bacterium]
MPLAPPSEQAAIAARLGVAAALIGTTAKVMVEHLGEVWAGGFRQVLAFTDANARTFGVGIAIDPDDYLARRMAALSAGVSGSKALSRAAMARKGDLWIERALGLGGVDALGPDGPSASLAIAGPATLADDGEAAQVIGLSAGVAAEVVARLGAFDREPATTSDRELRATIFSGPAGQDHRIELSAWLPDDALARLHAAATKLAITGAQLRLLDRIHPILAASHPVSIRIAARADAVVPGATLVYGPQTLDHALRVVTGLATDHDAATRWGAFVGATDASRVRVLELALGPHDPIAARLGCEVRSGLQTA